VLSFFVAEKRLGDLVKFDSLFDTVAEWLSATEVRVSGLIASVPSGVDDARDVLDACQTCLDELVRKQQDLDRLAAVACTLHHSDVSSSRSVIQLNLQYSLTTTKLKVKMLETQFYSISSSAYKISCTSLYPSTFSHQKTSQRNG